MAFSDNVRYKLSIETGGFCSNPDCRSLTGVFVPRAARSVGDGAHIVAENEDGPRGKSPLTQQQRAMESNGTWLCPTCHRIVDKTHPGDYSIDQLHHWKNEAKTWWRRNQGKQLHAIAQPDARALVARPSSASLLGAEAFLQAHQSLFNTLSNLRWQQSLPFQREIPISDAAEHHIQQMSTSPKIGLNWTTHWNTTYHCDDKELLGHMQELIRCTDKIRRTGPTIGVPQRMVDFNSPNIVAQDIDRYITTWKNFNNCLQSYKKWGQ